MNLSELKLAFFDYVDDPKQDQFEEAQAVRFLNTAIRIICRKVDAAADQKYFVRCALFNVVNANSIDQVFDLPADFKRVVLLELINGTEEPVECEWIDFNRRNSRPQWPPHHLNDIRSPLCFIKGKQFGVVRPTADHELRLWYSYVPQNLTDDDDELLEIPRDHHDTIALKAAQIAISGIEGKTFGLAPELADGMADLLTTTSQRNRQESRSVHYEE